MKKTLHAYFSVYKFIAVTVFVVLLSSICKAQTIPSPALLGYWQDWDDPTSPYIQLDQVDPRYNTVIVAFATPINGNEYQIGFTPYNVSQATFITQIQTLQSQGRKVLISIGGEGAPVSITNAAQESTFISTVESIISTYGFDGVDIDFEGTSLSVTNGSTITSPVDAPEIYLIAALKQIMQDYRAANNKKLLLTLAPETADVQGGMSSYGGVWGSYLPIVNGLKDSLDVLQVQLYNTGSMYGLDGNVYNEGTADFIVAETEASIKGFNTAGGLFAGLPASKIAVGLPSCVTAAGGGFTDTATVRAAMDYLLGKGPKPGSYTLEQTGGYPTLAGMMDWSVNYDNFCSNNSYAVNFQNIFNTPIVPVPETPYGGVPWPIPGTVQAENYDNGGQGVAYNDSDPTNDGGQYRTTEGVDIEASTDIGGGYDVGWTVAGEWEKYTVNVTASGTYNVGFRTASTSSSGIIRLEVDGIDVTGPVSLPNTSDYQDWVTTTVSNINLTAGIHTIRLFIIAGGFNLNYFTVTAPPAGPGYLYASGKNIVNNNGNFVIKAINIGDFMIQEGYMMNMTGAQYIYKQKITAMIGAAACDQFYANYYQNFITKADIDSISKMGFNSIRLPLDYELFTPLGQPTVFLTQGFTIVDSIVSWCKADNIYVILDLHAAPGGQNTGDISNYNPSQPSLWESTANQNQTVALWAALAQRYANEPYVGGYDLINETDWTLPGNTLLMQLMQNITTAIRQVDNNHILFIEGNNYANDYTGLTPKWDNNMAYSFHKYWNDNLASTLSFALSVRDGQDVPIWMGEFGENSNNWIADAETLVNQYNIGWAIWPYKKMSSVSSVSTFQQPANWTTFANYVNGGAMPSAAAGQAILNELLEDVKVANCTTNNGYLYALFKQPGNTNTVPYNNTAVSLPGKITAANYDEGKNGYAYNDSLYQDTQYGSTVGSSTSWNNGWYYRNDGVDLQYSTAENSPTVGWTETNDWMQYTVNIATAGSYNVIVRAASGAAGGKLSISSDGTTLISNATISATGGWDTWQ
ncbi:MAG TPA: carbohydrate-binding protein, partial [Ferruginibacter sp.]|nr:carbohydrate-binding protein [Ferruginibacter sp.]